MQRCPAKAWTCAAGWRFSAFADLDGPRKAHKKKMRVKTQSRTTSVMSAAAGGKRPRYEDSAAGAGNLRTLARRKYTGQAGESVFNDLQCIICMGIFQETTTVMECLHRFCRKCIQTSISKRKACPFCRKPVPSKRHLRPDPAFDALIKLIDGAGAEQRHEAETAKVIKSYNVSAFAASVEKANKLQQQQSKRVRISRRSSSQTSANPDLNAYKLKKGLGRRSKPSPVPEKIQFKLMHDSSSKRRHLNNLEKPVCRASNKVTIRNLYNFLEIKLQEQGPFQIALSEWSDGKSNGEDQEEPTVIEPDMSLGDIASTISNYRVDTPLLLLYSLKPRSPEES